MLKAEVEGRPSSQLVAEPAKHRGRQRTGSETWDCFANRPDAGRLFFPLVPCHALHTLHMSCRSANNQHTPSMLPSTPSFSMALPPSVSPPNLPPTCPPSSISPCCHAVGKCLPLGSAVVTVQSPSVSPSHPACLPGHLSHHHQAQQDRPAQARTPALRPQFWAGCPSSMIITKSLVSSNSMYMQAFTRSNYSHPNLCELPIFSLNTARRTAAPAPHLTCMRKHRMHAHTGKHASKQGPSTHTTFFTRPRCDRPVSLSASQTIYLHC